MFWASCLMFEIICVLYDTCVAFSSVRLIFSHFTVTNFFQYRLPTALSRPVLLLTICCADNCCPWHSEAHKFYVPETCTVWCLCIKQQAYTEVFFVAAIEWATLLLHGNRWCCFLCSAQSSHEQYFLFRFQKNIHLNKQYPISLVLQMHSCCKTNIPKKKRPHILFIILQTTSMPVSHTGAVLHVSAVCVPCLHKSPTY
jgi:hypothetical protein